MRLSDGLARSVVWFGWLNESGYVGGGVLVG